MNRVLIDTDIILDFFFDRKPFSDQAAIILTLCERKTLTGFVTPVMISNLYYILRQQARHSKVIEKLSQLTEIVEILSMDKMVVREALQSDFKDFEDALQHFAATTSGEVDVIITRNVKDYQRSSLGVLTPDNFIKGFVEG
ncbi:MAG: PIN domain-containing protein [Bacteroidales bacterium]